MMKTVVLISMGLVLLNTYGKQVDSAADAGWRDLFAERLDGWDTWLGSPHYSVELPGEGLGVRGEKRPPLGLNVDPKSVYSFIELEGKPTLFISGEIFGAVTTKEEFSNYHLSLRFKWGTKKWAPRAGALRDSGLLIHCFGEQGAVNTFWMNSVECQIQERDCGDLWLLGTEANIPHVERLDDAGKTNRIYSTGALLGPGVRHVEHGPSEEDLTGWNTVEVYTVGTTAVFVVNGVPNMVVFNAAIKRDGADGVPLSKGKIQLQSEGAEIYYQDLKIRSISAFPHFLLPVLERGGANSI